MLKDPPVIVIGDILLSNIRPWKIFPDTTTDVMISSYELLTKRGILAKIRARGGIRSFLELDDKIKLWLDSGGYQIMRKGLNISIERIARIYEEIDADFYISLDYPTLPGDSPRVREKKMRRNIKNFEFLINRFPDKTIIPVIHFSPNLDDYNFLVNTYIEEYGCEKIAFGGFVPPLLSVKGTKKARIKGILSLQYVALLAGRENIHVMGVGSATTISILHALRIGSADSASWRVKAAYGKIILPWGGERHVTNRKVNFGKKKLNREELNRLIDIISGIDHFPFSLPSYSKQNIEEFLNTNVFSRFENRAIFNAWVILHWAKIMPPKTGSFRSLYSLALQIRKISLEDIRNIWNNIDNVKQKDLLDYLSSNEIRGN
ncbi:MAG: hypothetical protein ACTSVA_01320 [Candidatus Njordarchaeales archaeon]